MKIVTVSRKPVAELSATANVVKWEAGALNIDGTRIGNDSRTYKGVGFSPQKVHGHDVGDTGIGMLDGSGSAMTFSATGRWPSNLILQHKPACAQTGTATAPGYTINRWTDGAKPFGGGAGHEYESEKQPDENVPVWECVEGCGVAGLGQQSGVSHGTGGAISGSTALGQSSGWNAHKNRMTSIERLNDTGTAARYFKQVKSEIDMERLPQELLDYLTTMISAPPSCEPLLIVSDTLEDVEWGAYEDQSVHGMVTVGNPGPHMKEIDRVLRPGAHLLVIASDEEPSGHTGACAVEDFGYEIRDAIAVLDAPDEFHYIPKPGTAEKNAGVAEHLDPRTKKMVQNNHETVKSIAIMEALLQDVPKDALVVDPFLGSGTTSLACLRTGHDFIGIEQDAEYIKICDQRARHWDRAFVAWRGATIESEAVFEKEDEEPVSIGELFGF